MKKMMRTSQETYTKRVLVLVEPEERISTRRPTSKTVVITKQRIPTRFGPEDATNYIPEIYTPEN